MAPNDMENTTDEGQPTSDNVPVVDPHVSIPVRPHADSESDIVADNAPVISTSETRPSEPLISAPAPLPMVCFELDADDICNISNVEIPKHTNVQNVHEGTEHGTPVGSFETDTSEASLGGDVGDLDHLRHVESARSVEPESRKRPAGNIPVPPQVTAEEDRLRLEEARKLVVRAVATESQTGSTEVICPSCGRQTRAGFTFCTKCGTDFPDDFMQSTVSKTPNPSTGVAILTRDTRQVIRKIQAIHQQEPPDGTGAPQENSPIGFFESKVLVNPISNPIACAALSMILPGIGNIAAGDRKNGIILLLVCIVMLFFGAGGTFVVAVRVLSAILAFQTATQRLREREDDDSNPKA